MHDFPSRNRKAPRRRRVSQSPGASVKLPQRQTEDDKPVALKTDSLSDNSTSLAPTYSSSQFGLREHLKQIQHDTPDTSQAPSECSSTQPTTPTSTVNKRPYHPGSAPRPAGTVVPAVPVISSRLRRAQPPIRHDNPTSPQDLKRDENDLSFSTQLPLRYPKTCLEAAEPPLEPRKSPPKSWADLVREKSHSTSPLNRRLESTPALLPTVLGSNQNVSVAKVLKRFSASPIDNGNQPIPFQPRGLVNTGNMCYMNSVSF